MRAALRIARADLAGRPMQTALTGFAIFAAATALVVTLALRSGLDDPFAAAQRATNGSHISVHGDTSLASLADLPGVAAAEARPRTNATTPLGGEAVDVGVEALTGTIDRPRVTDGRLPSAPNEALVERSFARQSGLRVGDTLPVRGTSRTLPLRIAGLAVTTEQATFPRWRPGMVWTAEANVTALGGARQRLGVRLADPEATDAFRIAAQRALPDARLGFTDWHAVRDTITDQAQTNTIIIGVNTLLALIAVGFTIATVISGRVLAQRREIGLLKAIGLSPRGVVALLVGQYAALAVVAGVLGLVAGTLIAPLLLEPMSTLLATPTPSAFQPGTALLSLALLVAAVAIFAALPALRAGRLNTVDALALGRASVSSGASRAARVAAALRLPTTARLGVKDVFTSRSRALLTAGALTMMVITLVAALSMEATFSRVIDDPALRAKPWDMRVEPGALETDEALRLVRSDPRVARATTIAGFQVATPRGREIQARAVGDGYEQFAYAVPDGRMFAAPGEAIAGRGLYESLGLDIGDELTLSVAGRPFTVTLVGRHVEPDDDGKVVIFPRETIAGAEWPGGDVIAGFAPGADGAAVASDLKQRSKHAVATELVSDEVRQERADIQPIVYGSSALLVGVGFVNLLTMLLLVTRERARDFGILKSIGLTPRGVLGVVNSGAAALGLIAVVAGIPAGIYIFRGLMGAMSPSEGTDIVGTPGPFALALVIPVVLAVTVLASSLPARQAARASAATVLRAE